MEPSKETKASEGKTELEQHEKDVLEDLEDEGIEMPTNVTEVLDSLPEEQKHVIVRALYAVGKSSSLMLLTKSSGRTRRAIWRTVIFSGSQLRIRITAMMATLLRSQPFRTLPIITFHSAFRCMSNRK